MNLKKLLFLAGMALVTVAFAAPATASAEWQHEGVPIVNDVTLEAEGTFEFETFIGGWHCTRLTAEFILEAGTTTGRFEEITAGPTCHGRGNLEGCEVLETDLTGEPILHQTGNDIRVTDVTLWTAYTQTVGSSVECGIEESQLDYHGEEFLTVEVDNRNAVGNLTVTAPNGGILTAFGLEISGAEIHADLTVEAPNHGTYGF